LVEDQAALVVLGGMSWEAPDGTVFLPFNRALAGGHSYLIATRDGIDFFEVWKSPAPYTTVGGGLLSAMGPTATGKVLGATAEASGTGKLFKMDAPTWSPRPTKFAALPVATHVKSGNLHPTNGQRYAAAIASPLSAA